MVSPDEDRILYDDEGDGVVVARMGPVAMVVAILVAVAGIAYFGLGSTGPEPIQATEALETLKPIAGFDASSNDFKTCEGIRQTQPDFSIVVAGDTAADVSRMVRFVVVDSYQDYRYGRDVRALSLCTLP